jgi:hypothetical protein
MILLTGFCFTVINSNFQLSEHSQGRLCDYSWAVACLFSATIKDDIVVLIGAFV